MRKYDGSTDFYQERAFDNKDYADEYARLMVKQEAGYTYYLFEQSNPSHIHVGIIGKIENYSAKNGHLGPCLGFRTLRFV